MLAVSATSVRESYDSVLVGLALPGFVMVLWLVARLWATTRPSEARRDSEPAPGSHVDALGLAGLAIALSATGLTYLLASFN